MGAGVGGNNGIMRRDKFIWYRMSYICGHYSSLQKQKSNLNPVIIEAADAWAYSLSLSKRRKIQMQHRGPVQQECLQKASVKRAVQLSEKNRSHIIRCKFENPLCKDSMIRDGRWSQVDHGGPGDIKQNKD